MKCWHCKDTHGTVAEVRECAGLPPTVQEMAKGFQSPPVGVQFKDLVANVPEGRYAVTLEGETKLRFFKLDKPTSGKWSGYTFVKEQASDELHPVRSAERRVRIAEAIAQDPEEAMLTYGRELGKCGHCGRTLTDQESREVGIGPVCRRKLSF